MATTWTEMLAEALGEAQAEVAEMHDVQLGQLNDNLRDAVSCETAEDFIANLDEALKAIESMKTDLILHRNDVRSYVGRASSKS